MSEVPLVGGDVNVGENVVVRVGDTVRRPVCDRAPAIHALLRHFEAVGFEGAPRVLGIDEQGREVLSFVEGDAALEPIPAGDDVLYELGRLARRMHDAQSGFVLPEGAHWPKRPTSPAPGDVVCHHDLFPPNVILRDGLPVALIDWDLSGPAPRLYDVASAANHWVPLRPADQAADWGLPAERHGERLRLLCDAYGLQRDKRVSLLDVVAHRNALGYETRRQLGGVERRPGWREMWNSGSGAEILARTAWFEAHRDDLLAFLR